MLDFNPNLEYVDKQEFTADGTPIPISGYPNVQTDAVPKMMDSVHAANDIGQELKSAWLKGAKEFMGGSGMLNSKPKDTGGRNKPVKKLKNLMSSEKPGWTMAEGTNFWSVNTDDPHWSTEEGYREAMSLYGEKPAWVKRPVEPKAMFANLEPSTVAAHLKKYF